MVLPSLHAEGIEDCSLEDFQASLGEGVQESIVESPPELEQSKIKEKADLKAKPAGSHSSSSTQTLHSTLS